MSIAWFIVFILLIIFWVPIVLISGALMGGGRDLSTGYTILFWFLLIVPVTVAGHRAFRSEPKNEKYY